MKFLTLAFVLLVSLNTLVRADDVVGKIFEDRKNGTQLQLKCLEQDENYRCQKMQYALVTGSRERIIGPVLGDEIFEFISSEIRSHLDEKKLKRAADEKYVDIPDFFPNGAFPATKWWYKDADIIDYPGAGFSAWLGFVALTAGGGLLAGIVEAGTISGPVGWAILGGAIVFCFAGPSIIDLVVLSAKGVALGVTSVAVGGDNLGRAIKNAVNKMKVKKDFNKLYKGMNGNPEVDRMSHKKFTRLVESIEALNF